MSLKNEGLFNPSLVIICYDQFNGSRLACGYELTNYQLVVN